MERNSDINLLNNFHARYVLSYGTQGGVRRETQQRDALGRLLRTENEHGQRTFSYNRLDQITAV
ncbi:hypothetical protein PZD73_004619, partial [Salmonella enterica]|nr:hypothetical protein [Salmonella enterica subsp. enterica serovar Senftenberg]EKG0385260.1 hypothetical protein [Salmonella enterica subsp. enterica serovar Senftenberg]EKG4766522.1 hypothetical protein [Salmonella enterica subsp. enterica serovar Senftenberg]EKO1645779.1 hypothetical protein [Salmonella enterica]HEC9861606.1 hypothetical protein [Salmonella enterica subsp. enterica serovar Senftenberg]